MASEPVPIQEVIRFGEEFELDLYLRELRRSGRVLKLERIPMQLLLLLVEQRGRIVTRDRIVERIWGKGVFLDTDNSINGAIRKIRHALRDHPERPRFVQTVPGAGYRFIAPVADSAITTPLAFPAAQAPAQEAALPETRAPRRLMAAALALLLLLSVLASFAWYTSPAAPPAAAAKPRLAVLPFANLTGDAAQEYFSDGLTEEMIAQLGRTDPHRLAVIARTSVMPYKNSPKRLDRIARDLGVQYVLEGSVRRDANRVRVTAQLIRAGDQTHIWARQYDRDVRDLLTLQSEIAQQISAEIRSALGTRMAGAPPPPAPRSSLSVEALDLYLNGRYYWNQRTPDGFRQAVDCFRKAIARDPSYARAYTGLADSYAMMSAYELVPPREFMPKARAAALTALQLDDSLAEAHTSLALIAQNYDYDWETANREFRRALQLNPNYATAHHWFSESLALQGRFDEALAESERARELDPLSLIISVDNGAILYFARQYDRAIDRFRSVLAMDPSFDRAHLLIPAYVQQGKFQQALADIRSLRENDNEPWPWAFQAYVYGRAGQPLKAQQALRKLLDLNRSRRLPASAALAFAYAGMNDKDRALASLETAYRNRTNLPTTLKVDPVYDPLRDDPRFQDLLHRVGLSRN